MGQKVNFSGIKEKSIDFSALVYIYLHLSTLVVRLWF